MFYFSVLRIESAFTLAEAVENIKKLTGLSHVRLAVGKGRTLDGKVANVALCAGSGGSVLKKVKNADLFLTGKRFDYFE